MTADFLARNLSILRGLGQDSKLSSDLTTARKADQKEAGAYTWYGIKDSGFYNPDSIEDFRGVKGIPRIIENGDEISKSMKNHGANEIEVDDYSRGNPYDRVYLGDPLLTEKLYGDDGSQVRNLFIEDDSLRSDLLDTSNQPSRNLTTELIAFAREVVPGLEVPEWAREGELARMVLENVGGLGDKIIENKDLRNLINTDSTDELINQSREAVLDELLPQIKNSSEIITEDFLRENPHIAFDLLANPESLHYVEEDLDQAREVVRYASESKNRIFDQMTANASSEVNQIPFSDDWFESNPEVAEIVASNKLTDSDNPLGQWMNRQEDYLQGESFSNDLIQKYWSDTAQSVTEDSLNSHLFEDSPTLSMLAVSNPEVRNLLVNNAVEINESYPDGNTNSPDLWVLRTYGIGLGENNYGDYQRVG